jgi:hypothetical protein
VSRLARRTSLVFAAGAVGALANSVALQAAVRAGLVHALGVDIAPPLATAWLYPRIVWGAIWGLLFLLPLSGRRWALEGLLLSLGPSLVQLFVVFPWKAHKGVLGLEMVAPTPLVVLLANAVWGLTAAAWLSWTGR